MLRWFVVAALVFALPACFRDASPTTGDLLLITVDALRADRVGLLGAERPTTPFLDSFFARGRVYRRAYASSASTTPSVITLLTGLAPDEHGVRLLYQLLRKEILTLPEQLPATFQTAAFVSNMVLADEAVGIASRFDHYDDFVDEREPGRRVYERGARRTTDAVLAWLATERDPSRRLFLWVHYIDPHGPYRAPDEARGRFDHAGPRTIDPDRVIDYQREPGVTDGLWYVDRYDEEVLYVDTQVARLLEGYQAGGGDLDRALVVFTADHGESMMEHEQWFTHGYQVYEEIARVPLLVRGPGAVAGTSDVPASGTDVAPTFLHAAGVPLPAGMPDVDLRTGRGAHPERPIHVEATSRDGQWRAVIRGDRKWMVQVRGAGRRVEAERVYDLSEDPQELTRERLDASEPGAAELLEKVRTDWQPAGVPPVMRDGVPLKAPKLARPVDPETRAKLEALGYAEQPKPADPYSTSPTR